MSAFAQRVLAAGRPIAAVPSSVWVPLLGAGWVASNLILIALGTQTSFLWVWSVMAGVLNGTILSVVAVAKASARFQSGATGLLGGMTLSGLRNDGSIIFHAVGALHAFVDKALDGLLPPDERLHEKVALMIVYMIWTTILVLMASLLMEWVNNVRQEQGQNGLKGA